ncbi:recombination-associated protein RdgC, partial [Proteus terrae]|uniref:recombination-associated protein RdgC n=1 Tax=Proteus terrae TaxID=1574161 RepID=UPI003314E23D
VMMCARKEDKILPATVIKQALQDKVEKLEGEQGRKLKKTEKANLKQELVSDEIATHIEAGKFVTKLSVDWEDRLQFMLCDDGSIKR